MMNQKQEQVYYEKSAANRRHEFRDAPCARQAFMCGGASAAGRMQVCYDRTCAVVDLDAICQNMESMKRSLPRETKIIGVVKADAYGHGAEAVADAISPYVWGFAVAAVDEAVLLRRYGIEKPVLVLGPVHESRYEDLLLGEIRPTIFTVEAARTFGKEASRLKVPGRIHLAVDTGMNRIGMEPSPEGVDLAKRIATCPGIIIEGIFTHFAKADEADKGPARKQLETYLEFLDKLEENNMDIPVRHCSNSAGILECLGTDLTAVRAGISIYGFYPSDQVDRERVKLMPAISWRARITCVKTIPAGASVSYGGTFTAKVPTRVATIAAGYGDGYSRALSGKGYVLIRDRKAPVLGRVCMDQFMVDVTGIPGVTEGEEAVLLGRDGENSITAEEMAFLSGGFHYEILCNIGKRVPRIYIKNGSVVGRKDLLSR